MLSWLTIFNNEIIDFSLVEVLFGKFDINEDFIVTRENEVRVRIPVPYDSLF